ncbi:MAG: extracellular solute-binding protein [Oscillospiraceae bacterium]|nr:extracellular solute-binding protein [Oscillospiraceae bacterium]
MKRIISLTVAALLTLSLAACGGGKKPITEDPNTPYKRYNETLNYTTVRRSPSDATLPAGWTLDSNPYTDFMKKDINTVGTVNWENPTLDDRLLLDLTANTLPDVFFVTNYSTFQTLYNADVLADLTDSYNNYATDKMKDQYNTYTGIWDPFTFNGRKFALPMTNNGYQQSLLWVRQDWLDRYNLPVPRTIADIENTARVFVDQNASGKDTGTIGINIMREDAFDGYRGTMGLETVASAMGAYPKQWMQRADGTVYYGSVQPEFKQVLAKVLNWVQTGLVPQDIFDTDTRIINAYPLTGDTGLWFFPWSWPYGNNSSFMTRNPDAKLTVVAAPFNVSGDTSKVDYFTGSPYEGMLCVKKGFSNPEVIFKVFALFSDMYNGIYQEGYEALQPARDANTPWYYLAPLGEYDCRYDDAMIRDVKDLDAYINNGITPDPFPQSTQLRFSLVKNYIDGTDTSATAWSEYMQRYVGAAVQGDPAFNAVHPVFFEQTQTMADDWTSLQNNERGMIYNILSDPTDYPLSATFDQFVADWKAGGGDAITAEVQAIVDARQAETGG